MSLRDMNRDPAVVRLLVSFYNRLLRLLPEEAEAPYRQEQLDLFRRIVSEAVRRQGLRGVAAAFLGAAWDLLVNLPTEYRRASHLSARVRAPGSSSRRKPPLFSPREGMTNINLELRQALRCLRRAPYFSLAVIVTLALGIGANSAIFSIVNGVLLNDLPYKSPDQLVRFVDPGQGSADRRPISYLNFVDWVERSQVFAQAAAYDEWNPNLTGVGEAERITAATVNWPFFRVLGVEPYRGRYFAEQDDVDGQDAVVILSYGFWQRKFGGRDDVIASEIQLNGRPHQIVGVAGPDFEDPLLSGISDRPLLWRPMGLTGLAADQLPNRSSHSYTAIARLRPDVALQQAQSALDAITPSILEEHPDLDPDLAISLEPLRETILGDVRTSLWVLMTAVGFLLAIAVVNVANLFLNRGSSRRAEFALRSALGAGRLRLLRQSLMESLLLSMLGGAAGLLLALWLMTTFHSLAAAFLPRSDQVGLDWKVLLFTAAVSLLTGVSAGLLPAWRSASSQVAEWLHDGGRTFSGGRSASRLRAVLVAAQAALALVLLSGSGLLLGSLWKLTSVDAGLQSSGVLTFRIELPSSHYAEKEQQEAFFDQLQQRLKALPSIKAVGRTSILPLSGSFDGMPVAPSDRPEPPPGESLSAQIRTVGGDYFKAMGIRLLEGRVFDRRDHSGSPPVVIVNRSLAQRFWPGQEAVSKALRVASAQDVEIVGVVDDVKHIRLEEEAPPRAYIAASQGLISWHLSRMTVVVKTGQRPEGLAAAVRQEVGQMDGLLPVSELRSMDEVLSRAASAPRFRTGLIGSLAVLALLLTIVGIYGVISYSVTQSLRTIAIRMALGAGRRQIFSNVLGTGLVPVLAGLALGLAGALVNSRLLEGLLFQIGPRDPLPYAAATLLLLAVALAANCLPARRATRTDPIMLLRD